MSVSLQQLELQVQRGVPGVRALLVQQLQKNA